MKLVTPDELGSVMPLFDKFATKAGFKDRMDTFKLFGSVDRGIRRGAAFIVTDDAYSKMLFCRLLSPELENKSVQLGVNAVWTDVENDIWVKESLEFIKSSVGTANNVEQYYFNVYPSAIDLYSTVIDDLEPYETAYQLKK